MPSVRRVVVVGVLVVGSAVVGVVAGWAAHDGDTGPGGIDQRDVYLSALEQVADIHGLSQDYTAEVVEYYGEYCGGIVRISDSGVEYLVVVGQDSGDPLPSIQDAAGVADARRSFGDDERCAR